MAKRRWQSRIGLVLLSLALVAILNPELRAGLLLVDSVGIDLVVVLISMQLRAMAPFLGPLLGSLLSPVLNSLGRIAALAGLYLYRSILPTLLYMLSPRLAPLALGLLLFLCATAQLQQKSLPLDPAARQ